MLNNLLVGGEGFVELGQLIIALPRPVVGRAAEGALGVFLLQARERLDGPRIIAGLITIEPDLILRLIANEGAGQRARDRIAEEASGTGHRRGGFAALFQSG